VYVRPSKFNFVDVPGVVEEVSGNAAKSQFPVPVDPVWTAMALLGGTMAVNDPPDTENLREL
jgi:hypothetical protein